LQFQVGKKPGSTNKQAARRDFETSGSKRCTANPRKILCIILLSSSFQPLRCHLLLSLRSACASRDSIFLPKSTSVNHHDLSIRQTYRQMFPIFPPLDRQIHWLISPALFTWILVELVFSFDIAGLAISSIIPSARCETDLNIPNQEMAVPSSSRYQAFGR